MLLLRSIPELEPFDLTPTIGNAGSTVDAMSDAIEGADVMIYGVSLAYKESANCRECTNNLIAFDDAILSDSASTSDSTMSCVALHACRAGG